MARIRPVHPDLWADEAKAAKLGSHVYIIQEGDSGPCKVGIARNAFWRRMDLQSGNYRPLHLRQLFQADERHQAIIAEAAVHKHFSQDRISGEWFSTPPEIIAAFLTEEICNGSY